MADIQDSLKGNHVYLRLMKAEDAEVTFKWRNLNRARLLNKGAQSVGEQKAWIENRPANEFNYIICLNDDTPVGMLSLVGVNKQNKNAESARFLIGEEDKVKGIPAAVEAMKLLYDFAFGTLELERIYGTVARENKLMIKWQKFLGMKEEGVLRRHYFIDGEFQDAVALGILKEEYYKEALPKMKVFLRS